MVEYKIFSKDKYFILKGKKISFSALDRISVSIELNKIKFSLYQEDIVKKSSHFLEIPPALAEDLINMCRVEANFGGYLFVHREIK